MKINPNIFREYDIRGVYPQDINEEVANQLGKTFGTLVLQKGMKQAIVGHDNRLSSPSLEKALVEGIRSTGVDVFCLGLCTTPMYYFACLYKEIPAGIMITASHNPKDENGFKVALVKGENLKGKEIKELYNILLQGKFVEGNGERYSLSVEEEYYQTIEESLHFGSRRVKVVLDCGNGSTSPFAKKLYERFPIDLITLYDQSDGSFPNHHPDPSIEENLDSLKKKVLETKADVGLAFDGDGDRVGVISNRGNFLPMDKYMIIIIRDLISKVSKKSFLFDIKCSNALKEEIEKLGGEAIEFRTGNSYTKKGVHDLKLPFGGEFSGHIYFCDRFLGFDSGLYAGLRLVEILSKTNKTVESLLDGIEEYIETPEMKIATTDEKKFKIIEKLEQYCKEKGYSYHTIDGVKVLFKDGFASVRASNTGPNITLRFEAKDKKTLEERKDEFFRVIEQYQEEV